MIYVEFQSWNNKFEELDEEQWLRVQVLIESAKRVEFKDRKEFLPYDKFTLSAQEAQELAEMGLKIELAPLPHNMFTKMSERNGYWEGKYGVEAGALANGNAANIHIPDLGLLMIKQVINLDDACTDLLRDYLSKGWKILAVCPPNAQRRPDYILGHNDPEAEL